MYTAIFNMVFLLVTALASTEVGPVTGPVTGGPLTGGPVVQIEGGKARGVRMSGGGSYFLGLPFAAPPTKQLRWQPPQPVKPWGPQEVIDASTFKPACAQLHDWSGRTDSSEDCLYLDVYTPKDNFGTTSTGNGSPMLPT